MRRMLKGLLSTALMVSGTFPVWGQGLPASQPAQSQPTASGDIAVTVNDHVILESEVAELIKARPMAGTTDAPVSATVMSQIARDQAVDRLIDDYLLDQDVARAGIKITDDDYAQAAKEELEAFLSLNGMTRGEFTDELRLDRGQTVEEFLKARATNSDRRHGLLYVKLFTLRLPDDMKVTDDDVRAQYDKKLDEKFKKPARVRASQIVISTTGATDEEKVAARQKATEVLAEARKPGADFAALAAKYSSDPSKARGGDMGFFPRTGLAPEPIAAAAFALQVGQISDIIETKLGFHILKVTGRADPVVIPLETAKVGIRAQLQDVKAQWARVKYVAELRKAATIVYPEGKEPKRSPIAPVTPEVTAPTRPK